MKPPVMCPKCESAFLSRLLLFGPLAAVAKHGFHDCEHVINVGAFKLVVDDAVPHNALVPHVPHRLVVRAYDAIPEPPEAADGR